jgi:hypothetical protein
MGTSSCEEVKTSLPTLATSGANRGLSRLTSFALWRLIAYVYRNPADTLQMSCLRP